MAKRDEIMKAAMQGVHDYLRTEQGVAEFGANAEVEDCDGSGFRIAYGNGDYEAIYCTVADLAD